LKKWSIRISIKSNQVKNPDEIEWFMNKGHHNVKPDIYNFL